MRSTDRRNLVEKNRNNRTDLCERGREVSGSQWIYSLFASQETRTSLLKCDVQTVCSVVLWCCARVFLVVVLLNSQWQSCCSRLWAVVCPLNTPITLAVAAAVSLGSLDRGNRHPACPRYLMNPETLLQQRAAPGDEWPRGVQRKTGTEVEAVSVFTGENATHEPCIRTTRKIETTRATMRVSSLSQL